ncbi:hypothetical protein PMIN04_008849 [Paraphaeosphaeria minitans]
MTNMKSSSPPSTRMVEVAARTRLLQPKPRPLPIPVGTTWLEDNVNEHSLFKTNRKAVNNSHETFEEYYAQPASRGSPTRQALFGLPETAELVAQIHQFQTQENDDPPPYSEAVQLPVSRIDLPAPAGTFSAISKHGNKLDEDGVLKSSSKRTLPLEYDSELDEASETQRAFSTFLRRSVVAPRQSVAGVLGLSGYARMSDENGVNLHSTRRLQLSRNR